MHVGDARFARAGELAAARALLLHLVVEAGLVDAEAALLGDDARQIDREAVGVVELEDRLARQRRALAELAELLVEQLQAAVERAAERVSSSASTVRDDQSLRLAQLGIGVAHLPNHLARTGCANGPRARPRRTPWRMARRMMRRST